MTNIQNARRALIARIVEGDGKASRALRQAAFDNEGLPETLRSLVSTLAEDCHAVTDEQVSGAVASGFTEDQLFELLVCAAVGQSARQHDAALRALSAAVMEG